MKKIMMVGIMLGGFTVTLEKGSRYYCVTTDGPGYYHCNGGMKTLKEAREYYREEVADLRATMEWNKKMEKELLGERQEW